MKRGSKKFAKVCALLLPLTGLTLTRPTLAQEGPIVFGAREKPPVFKFTDVQASLEAIYRRQSSTTHTEGEPSREFEENHFEEAITLDTHSYIYHPNLVDLSMSGRFGLQQDFIDNDGDKEARNGIVDEYDVNAVILRKETTPLTLYSRRVEDIVSRQFGPALNHTLMQTGAIWDIRSKKIPTRLEVFHSDERESGFATEAGSNGEFSLRQDTALWHSEIHPSDYQTVIWDATFSHVSQETAGLDSNEFNTIDAALSNSIDFGPKKRSNLFSIVQFFNQDGEFALQRFHWNELLRLQHTDNFETKYSYSLDTQSFQGQDQTTHRGVAGFIHRLYKSLVTTGNVGAQKLDFSSGGGNFEYFSDLRFDYIKKIPYGRLTSFLGGGFNFQNNEGTTSQTNVFNAPFTFTDPNPIVIVGRAIVPNSLVVTNASGLVQYVQGIDYTLDVFPQFVQLNRVVGGRIAEGQPVLIDYALAPQGENTVSTTFFNLGGRYDIEKGPLKGLGVYSRYAQQDQTIDSRDPFEFTANSFTDIVGGVDYRIKGLLVGAEREMHDSTVFPFNANRFFARYSTRASADTIYTLNLTYNQIEYPDENNQVDFVSVAGQVQHRITRELTAVASMRYQYEMNDQSGNSQGLEEQAELRWSHRQTDVYLLFRNATFESERQDNSFQLLEFGIRRQF